MPRNIDTRGLAAVVDELGATEGATGDDDLPERVRLAARLAGAAESLLLDAVADAGGAPERLWPEVERHVFDAAEWDPEQPIAVLAHRSVRLVTAIDVAAHDDDPFMTAAGLAAALCADVLDTKIGDATGDQERARTASALVGSALGNLRAAVDALPVTPAS